MDVCFVEYAERGVALVGEHQHDREAIGARPARTARPVGVVAVVGGRVDLDHQVHRVHVNPAGSHIGGYKNWEPAGTELDHDEVAFRLRAIAVQRRRRNAIRTHVGRDAVGGELGPHEAQGASFAGRHASGHLVLLVRRNGDHDVALGRHGAAVSDVVQHWVVHVPLHQVVDDAVEGRREQQALRIGGGLVEDFSDLLAESHLGHVIGLVEHRDGRMRQVDVPAPHEVCQATGSRDDEMDSALDCHDLLAHRQPARDEPVRELGRVSVRLQGVADLHGELSRWHKHERVDLVTFGLGQVRYASQDRQAKREGLSGSCARLAEHVLASHGIGDRGGLNGERHCQLVVSERGHEPLGKTEIGEGRG